MSRPSRRRPERESGTGGRSRAIKAMDAAPTHEAEAAPAEEQPGHRPYRVRLPGFLIEKEIGLGDVIKRATSYAGIRPCGGCSQRAAALNSRVVLTPGPRR